MPRILTEENDMVSRQFRYSAMCFLVTSAMGLLLGLGRDAEAFVRSEDELMQTEIAEAKARAKDFKRHQERVARIEAERGRGADEIKAQRRRFEEEQEAARVHYIEKRVDPLKRYEIQARMEAEDESRVERAADAMDKLRRDYLKKRDRIEKALERDAYIDPAEEYDIHPLPTAKKNSSGEHGAASGSINENF